MLTWFDSHAHVDGPDFDGDREAVMARARAAGVTHMLAIGAVGDPAAAARAVALAEREATVWATVATHPHDVAQMTSQWWTDLETLARHPKVVAIGETGLDYYYDHAPADLQRACFVEFIAMAQRLQKPVMCHIRDAHADAIAILRDTEAAGNGVIIHCFTGTPEEASAYVELGCYVSFSGIVTYKTAHPIREAARLVPLDRLLVETDCPYLAPVPKRGKRNEPAFVIHTGELLADVLQVPVETLARHTFDNAFRAFRIPRGA